MHTREQKESIDLTYGSDRGQIEQLPLLPDLAPRRPLKFDIIKQQLYLAAPMTAIGLMETLNNFFMGLFLSQLQSGNNALAIGPLIGPTKSLLITVSLAPLHSMSILIRQSKGAGQSENIGLIWQQGMVISMLVSVPNIIIMSSALAPTYLALGQDKELTNLVQLYFNAYRWGVLPNALYSCAEELSFGTNRQKLIFGIRVFKLLVLGLASYGLGFGRSSDLDVSSLAYAFVIQAWVGMAAYLAWLFFRKEFNEYGLFKWKNENKSLIFKKLLGIGSPMSLAALNDLSSGFTTSMLIGNLGKPSLITQEIVSSYFSLMVEPIFAISRGTGFLVGEAFGRKQYETIRSLGYTGIQIAAIYASLGFLFSAAPKLLASVFIDVNSDNTEVLELLKSTLVLTAIFQWMRSFQSTGYGALAGLSDTLVPTLISSLSTWIIGMPLAFYLSQYEQLGLTGLLIGQTIAVLVGSISMLYRWHYKSTNSGIIENTIRPSKGDTNRLTTETSSPKKLFSFSNYCPNFWRASPLQTSDDVSDHVTSMVADPTLMSYPAYSR